MDYSQEIYDAVEKYFIEDGAKYEAHEDEGYFSARYSLSHSCSINSAELAILVYPDGFMARFAIAGIKAGEPARKAVCELISRINDRMRYGNFEMDMRDGEVAFKQSNFLPKNAEPDYAFFDKIICLGLGMIEKYSGALCPIMLGLTDDVEKMFEKGVKNS